jgi:hypothetical protein
VSFERILGVRRPGAALARGGNEASGGKPAFPTLRFSACPRCWSRRSCALSLVNQDQSADRSAHSKEKSPKEETT